MLTKKTKVWLQDEWYLICGKPVTTGWERTRWYIWGIPVWQWTDLLFIQY